jgi:hypothetical protein
MLRTVTFSRQIAAEALAVNGLTNQSSNLNK